jgi:hypothetical protein
METSRAVSITSTANDEKNSELKSSSGLLGKNGETAPATSSNQVRSVEKDSNKMNSPSLEEGGDDKGHEIGLMTRLKERWSETITHEESTIPLAWQALLTGLVDALLYGKSTIWTGFQTGEWVYGDWFTTLAEQNSAIMNIRKHGAVLPEHCPIYAARSRKVSPPHIGTIFERFIFSLGKLFGFQRWTKMG